MERKDINVLVACECSGIVREAFIQKGFNAWSCDIVPSDNPGNHFECDVKEALKIMKWHVIIAFPPCTHLAVSGSRYFTKKKKDGRMQQGIDFFMSMVKAGSDAYFIAVENPVGIMSSKYRKPDQIIQPYEFGHEESKKTCLWLKNLPLLQPTKIISLPECGYWNNTTESGQNKVIHEGKLIAWNDPVTAKVRSKTYQGIADAMAEQWGDYIYSRLRNSSKNSSREFMTKPFKTYNGGKNGSGVYQAIINQIPPHEIFISGFAGNCGVLANIKRAADVSIAVDIDTKVYEGWKKIAGVTAVNESFLTWFPAYIGKQKVEHSIFDNKFFIFLDPPYLASVRSSQASLYDFEMTDIATHKKLLLQLKKCPYPVCIVHYPCELYDTELSEWRHVDIQGRTRNGMRTERLYMNYPEPVALHDYTYIGSNYREREEYKKAKKNVINKFERMPALERNFIVAALKERRLV